MRYIDGIHMMWYAAEICVSFHFFSSLTCV